MYINKNVVKQRTNSIIHYKVIQTFNRLVLKTFRFSLEH